MNFVSPLKRTYDGVSKTFRTGRLERELQMLQLSATRCNCVAILWVSLVNFASITVCVAFQRVFIVVSVYFVITQSGNFCIHPRIYFITPQIKTALGPTQPPIQWVRGALSLGIKRPGREADHSPPSSAEVKNTWSFTSTPPMCLHGVVLS
jgi:hypothetical protein